MAVNRLEADKDLLILALTKGCDRYVFTYHAHQSLKMLRHLGSLAADEDLSFSWYDAAVLSQKVRKQGAKEN